MLKITTRQYEALRADALRSLVPELAAHLRGAFPAQLSDHNLSGERLEPSLEAHLTRAQAYGFDRQDDFRVFAEALAIFGPDFDRFGWAAELLNRPRLTGYEKAQLLLDQMVFAA